MKPTYTENRQDVLKTAHKIITTYTVQISSYSQYKLLKKNCLLVVRLLFYCFMCTSQVHVDITQIQSLSSANRESRQVVCSKLSLDA